MPDAPTPYSSYSNDQRSWWSRTFGRSILSALIGHFFGDKNNAASIIAILLVATLCYIVAVREKYEYVNGLLNIVFVVIGYYFGSKREKERDDDDGPAPVGSEGTQKEP
jgi:hypothetical protein